MFSQPIKSNMRVSFLQKILTQYDEKKSITKKFVGLFGVDSIDEIGKLREFVTGLGLGDRELNQTELLNLANLLMVYGNPSNISANTFFQNIKKEFGESLLEGASILKKNNILDLNLFNILCQNPATGANTANEIIVRRKEEKRLREEKEQAIAEQKRQEENARKEKRRVEEEEIRRENAREYKKQQGYYSITDFDLSNRRILSDGSKYHNWRETWCSGATALCVMPNGEMLRGIYDSKNDVYEIAVLDRNGQRKKTLCSGSQHHNWNDTRRAGATALAILPNGNILQGIYDSKNDLYEIAILDENGLNRKILCSGRQHHNWSDSRRAGATALAVLPNGQILQGIYDTKNDVYEMAILNSIGQRIKSIYRGTDYHNWSESRRAGATALAVMPNGQILQGIHDPKNSLFEITVLSPETFQKIQILCNDAGVHNWHESSLRGASALAVLPNEGILQGIYDTKYNVFQISLFPMSPDQRNEICEYLKSFKHLIPELGNLVTDYLYGEPVRKVKKLTQESDNAVDEILELKSNDNSMRNG